MILIPALMIVVGCVALAIMRSRPTALDLGAFACLLLAITVVAVWLATYSELSIRHNKLFLTLDASFPWVVGALQLGGLVLLVLAFARRLRTRTRPVPGS